MARKTLYCVDTDIRGRRGELTTDEHREFKTAENAFRRAKPMAGKAVGALAHEIDADHEYEGYREPRALAQFGKTPEP